MSSFQTSLALNTNAPRDLRLHLLWLATLANDTGKFFVPLDYASEYFGCDINGIQTIFQMLELNDLLSLTEPFEYDSESGLFTGTLAIPVPPMEQWRISK